MCGLQCGAKRIEQIGRLAERGGTAFGWFPDQMTTPEVQRIGQPYRLPYLQSEFSTAISCKARHHGHASLLDRQAPLKGMIIVWSFRLMPRLPLEAARAEAVHIAQGHALAADLLLRLVYIPSAIRVEPCRSSVSWGPTKTTSPCHSSQAESQRQRKAQAPCLKTAFE